MTRSVTLTALALGLSLASTATAQPLVQARAHSGPSSAVPGVDLGRRPYRGRRHR